MGLADYRKAVQLLDGKLRSRVRAAGPKSEEVVSAAEEALDFRFPNSYRQFCLDNGAGKFAGAEFFGVLEKSDHKHDYARQWPPGRSNHGEGYKPKRGDTYELLDTVALTLAQRKKGIPNNLVIVKTQGYGGIRSIYIVDEEGKKEGPVVMWTRGWPGWEKGKIHPAKSYSIIAKDFGAFFLKEIKFQVELAELS